MAGEAQRGRRGRILYSILALLFAVGVVPLVWTSYRLVATSRQSMESDQKEWQLDKARLISTQVATYVDSLRSQVTAIARTLEVDAGATSFAARLERIGADKALERFFSRKRAHLVYVAVLDPTGKGAQAGLDLQGDAKLQEQLSEAFQRGQHGTPMLSVPVVSDGARRAGGRDRRAGARRRLASRASSWPWPACSGSARSRRPPAAASSRSTSSTTAAG